MTISRKIGKVRGLLLIKYIHNQMEEEVAYVQETSGFVRLIGLVVCQERSQCSKSHGLRHTNTTKHELKIFRDYRKKREKGEVN